MRARAWRVVVVDGRPSVRGGIEETHRREHGNALSVFEKLGAVESSAPIAIRTGSRQIQEPPSGVSCRRRDGSFALVGDEPTGQGGGSAATRREPGNARSGFGSIGVGPSVGRTPCPVTCPRKETGQAAVFESKGGGKGSFAEGRPSWRARGSSARPKGHGSDRADGQRRPIPGTDGSSACSMARNRIPSGTVFEACRRICRPVGFAGPPPSGPGPGFRSNWAGPHSAPSFGGRPPTQGNAFPTISPLSLHAMECCAPFDVWQSSSWDDLGGSRLQHAMACACRVVARVFGRHERASAIRR